VFFFARIAFFLGPVLLVTLAWQLVELPGLLAVLRKHFAFGGSLRVVAAALVVFGTIYAIANQLPDGMLERYASHSTYSIWASRHNNLALLWADRVRALAAGEPGVVLADVESSYELAGLTGRKVVAVPFGHGSYQDEARDGALRRGDVVDALKPSTDSTTLLSVLFRYRVTLVMVDLARDGPGTWDWIAGQKELTPVAHGRSWRLYRFDPMLVDQTLDIPLQGGIGMIPSQVIAGRAIFIRAASSGSAQLAQATASGTTSRTRFETQFRVPDQAGATVTAPFLLPLSAPVDRYTITVSIAGSAGVMAGTVDVGNAFEAEYFAGVIFGLRGAYAHMPGWELVDKSAFNGGEAAVALRTESVASHPFISPPGDYCLAIVVSDPKQGHTDLLAIGTGGNVASATWVSGASSKADEIWMLVRVGSTSNQLTYWVPGGAAIGVAVDRLTLYPPPNGNGTCSAAQTK
jgi:hypothetical protein